MFADRVRSRPVLVRHRLIDNDDFWRGTVVMCVECAATNKRYAHCLEIRIAHQPGGDAQTPLSFRHGITIDDNIARLINAGRLGISIRKPVARCQKWPDDTSRCS